MIPNTPLVSCLCYIPNPEIDSRPAWDSFCDQTYPQLEFIAILGPGVEWKYDENRCQVLSSRRIMPPLEALDLATECATGELACVWSPNSFSSSSRIARQAAPLLGSSLSGTILGEGLVWSNTGISYVKDRNRFGPQSVMFSRNCFFKSDNRLFWGWNVLNKLSYQGYLQELAPAGLFGIRVKEDAALPYSPEERGALTFDPWELARKHGCDFG